jgi:phage-related minor tail protein
MPAINSLIVYITSVLVSIKDWIAEHKELVKTIASIAAVLGLFLASALPVVSAVKFFWFFCPHIQISVWQQG